MAIGTEEYRRLDEEWGDKMEKLFGPTLLGFPEGCDSSRLNMFSSNQKQFLTLMNPDVPHILTGYENMFGDYSHAYKRMTGRWEVRYIVPKYKTGDVYMMFLYNPDTDTWDCVEKQIAENLTEKFGFAYNTSFMDSLKEGDVITDAVLYKSTSYDEHMNYRIGKNARVMYVTDNSTIEDAIKLRRGWANGVQSVEVDEVRVMINSNDFLKNLYGDDQNYKSFPDIGEHVHDSVVCAVGRINLNHALYDFQDRHLRSIAYTDTLYHAPKGSKIYDIDIYYNGEGEFPDTVFYRQLRTYYDMECEYADRVAHICSTIMDSGSRCTPQISYYKARYQHFTDRQYSWKDRDRVFANMVVVFKTCSVVDLQEGFKLTGRYGDKGIISKITTAGEMSSDVPPAAAYNQIAQCIMDQFSDDSNPHTMAENAKNVDIVEDCDMPYYFTEDGEKVVVDILLNSSGAIRRLNSDQLYEVEINFIGEHLQRYIRKLPTVEEKLAVVFRFLELLNQEEHDYYLNLWNSYTQIEAVGQNEIELYDRQAQEDFIKDIEENGFYIVKRPDSHIRYDCLKRLYDEWPWIKPYDVYIDLFGMKQKKIMRPAVIGSKYMCLLKQTSNKNFSARSTGRTDKRQCPAKSNDKKTGLAAYSRSPIKIGETHNLMAALSGSTIAEFNIFTRSSPIGRKSLDRILRASGDPFNIEKLVVKDEYTNVNAQILDAYLKGIGVRINYMVDGEYEEISRNVITEFRVRGYTIMDYLQNRPIYEKLFDKYHEFLDENTVVTNDPDGVRKSAWEYVFSLPEVQEMIQDVPNLTADLLIAITSTKKPELDISSEETDDLDDDTLAEESV